jgi:glutamine cyclotransferase
VVTRWAAGLLALAASGVASAGEPASPAALAGLPRCDYDLVRTLPHRSDAFTQGLALVDGRFYEGTGLYGRSSLTVLDAASGRPLRQRPLEGGYFGEGVTVLGDRVYQLTWREGAGFVYDRESLAPVGRFRYSGEGWGLATDGRRLLMSDGSAALRFLDPQTLRETGRVTVRAQGRPVEALNELEYARGEVLANVWQTDAVVRVDPANGAVRGWLDLGPLRAREGTLPDEAVANGIAFDPASGELVVTGKLWKRMYVLRPKGEGCGPLARQGPAE